MPRFCHNVLHTTASKMHRLSALEVLDGFNAGKFSVEQYALSLLDGIEEREPVVKAWAHISRSQVLAQARALDDVLKSELGPLHGVGVGVKDIIYTKGKLWKSLLAA